MASVARQLRRSPRGLLGVVRRSQCGFPQVVLTAPLLIHGGGGDEPEVPKVEVFPTQFWLTCPLLYEAIARLESDGWIERLEARLRGDEEFRRALERSHRAAAAFRLQLVPPEWRRRLQEEPAYRGHWIALTGTGVAGIRPSAGGQASGIKCLHAHYADWVGRGDNPVGAWVAERLAEAGVRENCDDRCPERCRGEARPGAGDGWKTVAAVDVGSHSVRLLVCDVAEPSGAGGGAAGEPAPGKPAAGEPAPAREQAVWYQVERDHMGVRLAAGWRPGEPLDPDAVERAVAALHRFARRMRELGVHGTEAVATGVVREAADGARFAARVREETGIPLRIISGEEEAALSFRGAVRGMAPPASPVAVALLDIGGGTTEWVTGTVWPEEGPAPVEGPAPGAPDGEGPGQEGTAGPYAFRIEGSGSLPLGAERLTRAFLHGDPPTDDEWARLMEHLQAAWTAGGPTPDTGGARHVLAVGGTVTSLAAMDLGLVAYDRSRVHRHRLSRETVEALVDRLRTMPVRERARLPGLQPQRAPIIAAGAAIVWSAMEFLGAPWVEVSEWDILEGLLC